SGHADAEAARLIEEEQRLGQISAERAAGPGDQHGAAPQLLEGQGIGRDLLEIAGDDRMAQAPRRLLQRSARVNGGPRPRNISAAADVWHRLPQLAEGPPDMERAHTAI